MPLLDRSRSVLLVIDLQARLMPVIHRAEEVLANAGRLLGAAEALSVPVVMTEQNPAGLGGTVPAVARPGGEVPVLAKMTFDACRGEGLLDALPAGAQLVVTGCEAHVCVLQTVLGLLDSSRPVFVVADAVGSRRAENREAALRRMERAGAEVVTTEMVLFEWLATASDPAFKQVLALIR